ncbi:MAG: DUF6527 family protein [Ancalomicrobiaceae bacterium]|nr:DUF6527 family protein [Ancalomicrobiaceae bacterium]
MAALGLKLRTAEGGYVAFFCPGCDEGHMMRIGDGPSPRWSFNGNAEKPTFSPSVLVFLPERIDRNGNHHPQKTLCHSFVRDGRIEFLSDSAHGLAGQTVDLPDWPADYGFGGD